MSTWVNRVFRRKYRKQVNEWRCKTAHKKKIKTETTWSDTPPLDLVDLEGKPWFVCMTECRSIPPWCLSSLSRSHSQLWMIITGYKRTPGTRPVCVWVCERRPPRLGPLLWLIVLTVRLPNERDKAGWSGPVKTREEQSQATPHLRMIGETRGLMKWLIITHWPAHAETSAASWRGATIKEGTCWGENNDKTR